MSVWGPSVPTGSSSRGKQGERRRRIVHGEVHRVRSSTPRRGVGYYHCVGPSRSLVRPGQGNSQLRRAHERRRMPHPVVSDRRGGNEVRAIDGERLCRCPGAGRRRGKGRDGRPQIVHGEVHRVRSSTPRRGVGYYHRVGPSRSLVRPGQGNSQLRRAHERRRMPHPVVSDRRGGNEVRAIDGERLCRCPGAGRRRGKGRDGRPQIVHGEVHRVRSSTPRRGVGYYHCVGPSRSLVRPGQGNSQLRRAHERRRMRHRVVSHRRARDEVRPCQGQGLRRRAGGGRSWRQAGERRRRIIHREGRGTRRASTRGGIRHGNAERPGCCNVSTGERKRQLGAVDKGNCIVAKAVEAHR